jgi:hypothetical protein
MSEDWPISRLETIYQRIEYSDKYVTIINKEQDFAKEKGGMLWMRQWDWLALSLTFGGLNTVVECYSNA